MMNKIEMVNNKRVIAKALDASKSKEFTVFTWLNSCWSEEDGHYTSLEVMIDDMVWKQVKIADGTNKYEEDKLMYQCYKATIELCKWARAKYGEDKVKYPNFIGVDEWLIID